MAGLLDAMNNAQKIEAIYVAYFGRAADGGGYLYWQNAAQTMSPVAIANSFAVQPEATAEYAFLANPPQTLSPTDPIQIAAIDTFINAVYQNLFTHAADAGGLAYWQGQILSGAVSIGSAVYAIANGALGADVTALTDKITAATYFTQNTFADNLGVTSPLSASFIAAAEASVAGVHDAGTLTASEAATTAYVSPLFAVTDNASGAHVTTNVAPTATTGGSAAEGNTITYTVHAPADVANGTVENYTLTGTGNALSQLSSAQTGTVTVQNGTAILAVNTMATVLGGANPTLTLTLSDHVTAATLATDVVTINEAQQAVAPLPLVTSVTEGSIINFAVSTTGVAGALVQGTTETYTISGAPGQIQGTDRSGSFTLDSSGAAVVPIHTLATVFNSTSAPTLTLNFTNAGGAVSSTAITVNEAALLTATDNAAGTHATVATTPGTQIVESTTGGHITDGQSVMFAVATSGVAGGAVAGTQETWNLSGTALSDVVGPTSGTITLDSNGAAAVTVLTNFSASAAGSLVFSLNTNNVANTPDVVDTVTLNAATQTVTPSVTSVNEGSSINLTVATPGVSGASIAGTQESYTLTGAAIAQIPTAEQTGTVTLDTNGQATVHVDTLATVFNSTSAPTFTLTLNNGSASPPTSTVTLNEVAVLAAADSAGGTTVQTHVGGQVVESTTGGHITDGQSVTFNVATSGVAGGAVAGTQETWSLSGTALSDVVGPTSGVLTLDANGNASVMVLTNFSASAAGSLEFSLNALPVTDTVTLNAATQTVTPSVTSVNEGSSINLTVNTNSGAGVAGTTESYTLTGAAIAQIPAAEQAGTVTLDANGQATVHVDTLATVFNTTSNPTFTLTLNNGSASPPTSTVTVNEVAVLAAADSAGGLTTTGSFGNLVTESTAGGVISDGSSVTFTVSTSGVAGAAVAGTQEAWTLSGTALSQVLSATSGTVTLDANGSASVTVQTNLSASAGGSLEFSLNALPVTDTVTVTVPASLYFTSLVGETLLGGPQDTTFVGVVDSLTVGNNTMSNVVDSAEGMAGYQNTLAIVVNAAATDIIPGGPTNMDSNIQTLNVTDINPNSVTEYYSGAVTTGTYFNLQFMPQLATINLIGSDVGYDGFFNVQNLVNVGVTNSDYASGATVEVDVVSTVAGGPVTVTLNNSGSFELIYLHTDGTDFATAFNFVNGGDNGISLVGATQAQSITVTSLNALAGGSLWMSFPNSGYFSTDQRDLLNLTSVDASGLGGAYDTTEYQFGFNNANIYNGLTFLGAQGNTLVDLNLEVSGAARGGTFTITTYGGNDDIYIDSSNGDGETITVNSGDGNTSNSSTGSLNGGDSIDLYGSMAIYQTLGVTVGDGNNTVNILSADNANVTVTQESLTSGLATGNNNINIDLWNGQMLGMASAVVLVTVLDGTNDIHINTAASGANGDDGSTVTVNAGSGANNDIHIREGYDSTTNVTVGNGNGTSVHVSNYGGWFTTASANITVGTGSGIVVGYHDHNTGYDDVTINLGATVLGGDTGAGGTVWADVGVYSTLTENLGSGVYTIHDDVGGSYSSVTINALDTAGGGDTIDVTLNGSVYDDAYIMMGGGNNTIDVTQDSSGTSTASYATVSIQTQDATGAGNTIDVTLNGSYDRALITVGDGDNSITVVDIVGTGDYVDIQAGGGSNTISVDLSGVTASTVIIDAGSALTTGNNIIDVTLAGDAASSAQITTGGGNDSIYVTGTAGVAAVTVNAGAGNDWVGVDSLTLPANISLDGGTGTNTLGLPGDATALAAIATQVAATIQNFQILELTSVMNQAVNLLDLGAGNNINQVILDGGYAGSVFLTGLNTGAEIDLLWGQSGGQTLLVNVGLGFDPNATVNLLLDSQADKADHHFGTIELVNAILAPVETVNLTSTANYGDYWYSHTENYVSLNDPMIHTLNIASTGLSDYGTILSEFQYSPIFGNTVWSDGDVYLNLTGSTLTGLVTVNANSFLAGIQETSGQFGNTNAITFNAVSTTYDHLTFGDYSGDVVHLGNYENTVTMGNGANDVLTLAHTSNVYGSSDGYNTVSVGSGSGDHVTIADGGNNSVTALDINAAGHAGDTIILGNGDANTVSVGAAHGDIITLGEAGGTVTSSAVTIHGDLSGGIDTVTFAASGGGGNTVTPIGVTGTTINLGSHTTSDMIVFNTLADSSFGFNDTITGFHAATSGSPDVIDLTNVYAADGATSHTFQTANGALAVLGLANANAAANDAVIYDYSAGILYDFTNGTHGSAATAANTMEIQLVGVLTGAGEAGQITMAHNILI